MASFDNSVIGKADQWNFYMCHVNSDIARQGLSGVKNPGMGFHFHEYYGIRPNRHLCGGDHTNRLDTRLGRQFTPVELALECARAKVNNDHDRFNRIKPIIAQIKDVIETELRKSDLGMKPHPREVIRRLLLPMTGRPVESQT